MMYLRGRRALRASSLLLPGSREVWCPPRLIERRVKGCSAEGSPFLWGGRRRRGEERGEGGDRYNAEVLHIFGVELHTNNS